MLLTDVAVDTNSLAWPKYSSSNIGELMVFQDQDGLFRRVVQNDKRALVYKAWGATLASMGEDPPF